MSQLSTKQHFAQFEAKGMPVQPPETKIVEAYGLGKCPKLVQQIAGDDLEVRINALAVLCDEFQNPYSIDGCARGGIIGVLSKMIKDPDYTTRVRATKALSIAAEDANGVRSILEDESVVIPQIAEGVEDPSEIVRGNVYQCLLNVTHTMEGVQSCVANGVTQAFVGVLSKEVDSLKPIVLKTLHNIVRSEEGLLAAINSDCVAVCLSLLLKSVKVAEAYSPYEASILSETSRTLGFMCFDGRAKEQALEQQAVAQLVHLLKKKSIAATVKPPITIALMSMTTASEGKIQVNTAEGVEIIIDQLYDNSRVVVMNTLKIISNIAVFPANRTILTADSACIVKLRKLSKSEDALIAKHAAVALKAVLWTP
ncbi:armadillo-type protein [Ochromonadaceae sp. CCMP2298]|nr:armadillo-type protein [Ochromonadaceae sp. CCMP2298]|mmetsp:Transcript_16646/g.36930  ORF Transcript_16646/g.36930 Transcript_16646/m.36930 type:complete len:368 (+) Transcript_16646:85-1188(+)